MDIKGIFKSKIAGNAIWIIAGKCVQASMALIINILTARYMGPTNYGFINYAASLTAFVIPIMNLGFSNVLVQELVNSPDQEGKIIGTATTLSVISSLFCMAGLSIFTFTVDAGEKIANITVVLYSILLVFQAFELIQYWFQYKLLSKYTAIASVVAYAMVFVYKVILIVNHASVYLFAVSNALDYFLIALILIVIYMCQGGQRFSFSWDTAKKMLNNSKHYIVSSMMVTVLSQTDKIMLKQMMDETTVGYYSAAVQCASVSSFVFVAIIDSFRPIILGYKKQDDVQRYEGSISSLYGIIIYCALLQCVLITLLVDPIVMILYGAQYTETKDVLPVVVWFTTFSYMGSVRNIWILAEHKQKYLWILNFGGAILNIVLNFLLIPLIGSLGAAIASVVTQAFTNIIMSLLIKPLRYNNTLIGRGLNIIKMFRH